jgi:hypothetical protein
VRRATAVVAVVLSLAALAVAAIAYAMGAGDYR